MRSVILALTLSVLPACTHLQAELVDVDGRTVEIVEAGQGAATVVFESGLDADWSPWDKVAYDLSDDARVFAYSRPGNGRSDDTTTPRDPATIVAELRGLLAAREVAPPYVLVGHSNGGAYMELFAKAHPEEVSALVLVDPRPKDFLEVCESEGIDMCGIPDSMLATQSEVVQEEYEGYAQAAEEITGEFGAYPVRVLSGTQYPGQSDAWMELFQSMQGDIAAEAQDGEHTVIDGPHNLQVFEWQDVSDVIRAVLP